MDKRKMMQIREQYDLVIHNSEDGTIEFWYARGLTRFHCSAYSFIKIFPPLIAK